MPNPITNPRDATAWLWNIDECPEHVRLEILKTFGAASAGAVTTIGGNDQEITRRTLQKRLMELVNDAREETQ